MKAKTHKGRIFFLQYAKWSKLEFWYIIYWTLCSFGMFGKLQKAPNLLYLAWVAPAVWLYPSNNEKKVSLRRAGNEGQSLLAWQQRTCVFVHAAVSLKKSINEDLICQNLKFNALECFLPLLILLQKNESKLQKVENKKAWKLCLWSHLQ